MFDNYYYNQRRPDPGDVFGSLVAFLVIAALLIWLTIYFSSIILLVFLIIGLAIGLVYALIVYIKALVVACKSIRGNSAPNGILGVLYNWFQIAKITSFTAFRNNLSVAHSAILKAGCYKFLSFRKWMWFIVAPSVLIVGSAMIVAIVLLQVAFLLSIVSICLGLLLLFAFVCFFIGIILSVKEVFSNLGNALTMRSPFSACAFSRSMRFYEIPEFFKDFYREVFGLITDIWDGAREIKNDRIAKMQCYSVFHIIRNYYLASIGSEYFLSCLLIAIFFIVFSLIFIFVLLAKLFWTTISTIFNL